MLEDNKALAGSWDSFGGGGVSVSLKSSERNAQVLELIKALIVASKSASNDGSNGKYLKGRENHNHTVTLSILAHF